MSHTPDPLNDEWPCTEAALRLLVELNQAELCKCARACQGITDPDRTVPALVAVLRQTVKVLSSLIVRDEMMEQAEALLSKCKEPK